MVDLDIIVIGNWGVNSITNYSKYIINYQLQLHAWKSNLITITIAQNGIEIT